MAIEGASTVGYVSRAPRLGFVGGFDGVRGIGVLMVLLNHAYADLSPSFAGIIDVFFVMSAFLITTLLMQEYGEHRTINMRKFYARRGVRLLPSAFLCILAWIVICALFDRERLVWVLQDAAAAVTYIYNLVFPVGLAFVDPVAASHRSIDHFWSLAVEEQFYLLIAVTVLVCLRRRWMVQLAIGLALVATWIGYQRWIGNTGPWPGGPNDDNLVSRGLSLLWLSRYDSLMWGVGLAVVNSKLPSPLPKLWRRWLPWVGALGLAVASATMLLASGFLRDNFAKAGVWYPYVPMYAPPEQYDGTLWLQFGYTLTAIAFAPAMLAMARVPEWWANRALSWKPIRFLGRMSYTIYVWHTLFYFIILELLGLNDVLGEKWRAPIMASVTVVLCLPIFYGVERRALRVKLRFANEKEVLDLNTGKMVSIEEAAARAGGPRVSVDVTDDGLTTVAAADAAADADDVADDADGDPDGGSNRAEVTAR